MKPAPPAGRPAAPPAVAPLSLRSELARKSLHASSVVAPAAYAAGLPRAILVGLLVALAAIALLVEVGRARSRRVAERFHGALGPLLRAHEQRGWAGATWLLLAFLAAALLFERQVAVAAMCAVSLGDASAAIVGRWIGRTRLRGRRKTLEGSVACALATLGAAHFVAGLGWPSAGVAGAVAAFAEWPEGRIGALVDDNVRIALATGCGILLWRLAFS